MFQRLSSHTTVKATITAILLVLLAFAGGPQTANSCCGNGEDKKCKKAKAKAGWRMVTMKSGDFAGMPTDWRWGYSVIAVCPPGVNEGPIQIAGGTIYSDQPFTEDHAVPMDRIIKVVIAPIQPTQPEQPTVPAPEDPIIIHDDYYDLDGTNERPQNPYDDPVPETSPPAPPTGTCLLKFDWCGDCSGPGNHCAAEGKSEFTIKSACSQPSGSACTSIGSVNFRVVLGRTDNDKTTTELILRQEDITPDSFNPAQLVLPGIVDKYRLEYYHWLPYRREDILDSDDDGEADFSSTLPVPYISFKKHSYIYFGDDGFKLLFRFFRFFSG